MVAGKAGPELYIGDWRIDPETDTISRADEVQKLEPRTMRLLLLLAHSPGAVISVERMLAEVWSGVVVSPASAYQAVSRLRRLLRDTDPDPTYIGTVPRKGYRLIAPVRHVDATAPAVDYPHGRTAADSNTNAVHTGDAVSASAPEVTEELHPAAAPEPAVPHSIDGPQRIDTPRPIDAAYRLDPPHSIDGPHPVDTPHPLAAPQPVAPAQIRATGPRWRRFAWIGLAALAVMGLAVWGFMQMKDTLPSAPEPLAIVVLPFIDMTAEKHDQAFCDGLTEELSNWLAQIPSLRVVARTSAFAYRGKDTDVRTIGRELGTSHVLEGSLRRSSTGLRVTAQLVSTRDGYHVWSATFDRSIDDVVKVQEEIARSVADNLEIRLTSRTAQRFAARRGATPQAYELYLLARHHQQELTRDSNNRAIELYKQALALDDHFALAYAGLARAYTNQLYLDGVAVKDVSARAEPLLSTGMRLNAGLPELYAARGGLRSDQGRYDEALRDLRHAIELNPNDSRSLAEMGYVLITNARPRDALSSYDRAIVLDPLDFNLHARRCIALTDMARFDEAELACTHARALAPASSWAYVATSWLEWARGRVDEALKWNALAIKASPNEFEPYDDRMSLLLTLGLIPEARDTLEKARAAVGDDERIAVRLAKISYYESGAQALSEQMQTRHVEDAKEPETLFLAARERLLLEDAPGAKRLLDKAIAASDLTRGTLDHPWYLREGDSNELVVAMTELKLGDRTSAERRIATLLSRVERLRQAGVERFGVYKLRAEALAVRGDLDGAMAALTHAAELGWCAASEALHDPAFAPLQSRPAFKNLLERVQSQDLRLGANVKR